MVGSNQNKYLIVVMDYFTKWIEAEALARITTQNVLCFYKRNILSRFGIPQVLYPKIFPLNSFKESLHAAMVFNRFSLPRLCRPQDTTLMRCLVRELEL